MNRGLAPAVLMLTVVLVAVIGDPRENLSRFLIDDHALAVKIAEIDRLRRFFLRLFPALALRALFLRHDDLDDNDADDYIQRRKRDDNRQQHEKIR